MTRQDILTTARDYLETKFRHQTHDCGQLLIKVCHRLDYHKEFTFHDYDRWPDGLTLDALLDAHFDRVPRSKLTYGDVVLCADVKTPCHVGIVGDKGHLAPDNFSIIHAWLKVRKVTENPLEIMRVLRCWRFRGVED